MCRRGLGLGFASMRPLSTCGFILYAGVRTNQHKASSRRNTPEEGIPGRRSAPLTNLPFLTAYNKRCCGRQRRLRRTGFSARWVVADLRPRMIDTNLPNNYVRTPRVEQVEQSRLFYPFHPKPLYCCTNFNHWNSGTMRFCFDRVRDKTVLGRKEMPNTEWVAISTVPPFQCRVVTSPCVGFAWNSSKEVHCSTRAIISGVIV